MKKVFFLAVIFIGILITFSDSWETKAPMPTPRAGAASAVIGSKIYIAGGSDTSGNQVNILEVYDTNSNTWETKAVLPDKVQGMSSAVYNEKMYVFGGYDGSQTLNYTKMYDPSDNTWYGKSNIPTARFDMIAEEVNGIIYVIGGYIYPENTKTDANEAYNPETNTWETKAVLPDEIRGMGSAVYKGKIYIFGGAAWDYEDSLYVYDTFTNIWETKTSMPTVRSYLTGTELFGKIYAIGGYYPFSSMDTVEIYDPITDTWKTGPSMITVRHFLCSNKVDNHIFVIGGTSVSSGVTDANEMYTPDMIYPELNTPPPCFANVITDTFTVIVKDKSGSETTPLEETSFLLSSDSSGDYHFYSDPDGIIEIYSIIISSEESRGYFFYKDTKVGTITITIQFDYGEPYDPFSGKVNLLVPITEYYEITTTSPQVAGTGWTETATAKDTYGNTVYTDSSTVIDLSNTGNAEFYSDGTYSILQSTTILNSGAATLYIRDTKAETIQISVSDTNAKTGSSGDITVLPERIVFIDPSSEVYANTLNKFSIGLLNQFAQTTVFKRGDLIISLNSTGNGIFKDDNGEINSVHIAEGESTADFYYINKVCESDMITASNLLLISAEHTLIVKPSKNLDNVVVYPNPVKDDFIYFENLTKDCTIYIYTITGELVYKYENDSGQNNFKWYLLNSNDNKVASGVYFYVIKDKDNAKKGKIAVVK